MKPSKIKCLQTPRFFSLNSRFSKSANNGHFLFIICSLKSICGSCGLTILLENTHATCPLLPVWSMGLFSYCHGCWTSQYRDISKGRLSLYLDHWPPVMINGKRKRKEYLGIYVRNKPRTSAEREENALLYKMAGLKLAERKIELSTPRGIKPKVSIRRWWVSIIMLFRLLLDTSTVIVVNTDSYKKSTQKCFSALWKCGGTTPISAVRLL